MDDKWLSCFDMAYWFITNQTLWTGTYIFVYFWCIYSWKGFIFWPQFTIGEPAVNVQIGNKTTHITLHEHIGSKKADVMFNETNICTFHYSEKTISRMEILQHSFNNRPKFDLFRIDVELAVTWYQLWIIRQPAKFPPPNPNRPTWKMHYRDAVTHEIIPPPLTPEERWRLYAKAVKILNAIGQIPLGLKFNSKMSFFTSLCLLSCISFFVVLFSPLDKVRYRSFLFSIFQFLFSLFGLFLSFFFFKDFSWLSDWNISCSLGFDSVSLFFIILSCFLSPICILLSWESVQYRLREFLFLLFFIIFVLINLFATTNLLFFYIFFELVTVPTFFVVGVWGSRLRRIFASFKFFLYTFAASMSFFFALLYSYYYFGSVNLLFLEQLLIPLELQFFLFLAFFFAFAVKLPLFPFHVWLPEAHVEAPTAGSVLLAGILLKLGGYGFYRFSIPIFPEASKFFSPFIFLLSLLAILYTSFSTIIQIDLKKAIAYSSVGHMAYTTIGLFSFTDEGVCGAVLLMVAHGLISSGLFICIGFLYDRYGSRLIRDYGGLAGVMPIFSSFFFIICLCSISFPGSLNFVAELSVYLGVFKVNFFVTIFSTIGTVLSAIYMIWIYNRLCFGRVCSNLFYISDLNIREIVVLLFLIVPTVFFGFYPVILFKLLNFSTSSLLAIV